MAGKAKLNVFNCPHCGAGLVLRAPGQSLVIACASCGSIMDTTNEDYRIISQYKINTRIRPLIPLGTRGKLRGETWEAIGLVIRSTEGLYSWREFLLFNPRQGFRWLTEYDGHWTFVTLIKTLPKKLGARQLKYEGKTFRHLQEGTSTVDYVLGEFYWQVKVGEKSYYADSISPPEMLSVEGGEGERIWSHGESIEPMAVSEAFAVGQMPIRIGVGACQPFPYAAALKSMWKNLAAFSVVLLMFFADSSELIFINLIVCEGLLILPPFVLYLLQIIFEQKRNGGDNS
jgi:hypothetical protein